MWLPSWQKTVPFFFVSVAHIRWPGQAWDLAAISFSCCPGDLLHFVFIAHLCNLFKVFASWILTLRTVQNVLIRSYLGSTVNLCVLITSLLIQLEMLEGAFFALAPHCSIWYSDTILGTAASWSPTVPCILYRCACSEYYLWNQAERRHINDVNSESKHRCREWRFTDAPESPVVPRQRMEHMYYQAFYHFFFKCSCSSFHWLLLR